MRTLLKHPKFIIILNVLITIALAIPLKNIKLENSIRDFFPLKHEAYQRLTETEEQFGSMIAIGISLETRRDSIMDEKNLDVIRKITAELEGVENTSDVISHGTLILNDRMKLYQVVGAYPKNDSYGQYISWNVQLQLFNLAKADGLPNDFKELIEENQYGLGKINI